MTKKGKYYLSILFIVILFFSYVPKNQMEIESINGTYIEGYEPRNENLIFVVRDKDFVLYNQKMWIQKGKMEYVSQMTEVYSYNLVGEDQRKVGHAYYNFQDNTILLYYDDLEILVLKINEVPTYLEYE